MGCYFFSAWSFDNVCFEPAEGGGSFKRDASAGDDGGPIDIEGYFYFCRKEPAFLWPRVRGAFMTDDQQAAVKLFRFACMGSVSAAVLYALFFSTNSLYRYLFNSTYTSVGDHTDIPFSTVAADM